MVPGIHVLKEEKGEQCLNSQVCKPCRWRQQEHGQAGLTSSVQGVAFWSTGSLTGARMVKSAAQCLKALSSKP